MPFAKLQILRAACLSFHNSFLRLRPHLHPLHRRLSFQGATDMTALVLMNGIDRSRSVRGLGGHQPQQSYN